MRRLLAGGLAAVALASGTTSARPVAASALSLDGQALRDADGRQVLLRGIAVIEKTPGKLPPFTRADADRIRSWGMNSIRLGFVWGGIEPRPGVYDTAYLRGLAQIARTAADSGLYVVLDMHQDLYGAPWGDGAPAWAGTTACPHVDLGAATGSWGANYLSPAVVCAFGTFWTSEALQQHYAGAWQAVARAVRGIPRIAGYDLMNEPSQGFVPPAVFETRYLYPSQAQWLQAIRQVDPHAVGFLEPPNYKYEEVPTTPPTIPAGAAYGPHLYGPWDDVEQASQTRALADPTMSYMAEEARLAGVPLWVGEFGVQWKIEGAVDFVSHVMDLADGALAGTSYWEYGCGDGYSPLDSSCRPTPLLAALLRAYPSSTAGTLTAVAYDRASRRLQVSWSQMGAHPTVLETPVLLYPHGVVVSGAGSWRYDRRAGRVLVWGASGANTVTVSPAG